MHVLLVVNPTAGSGRAARIAPAIARALKESGRDVETVVTTSSVELRRVVSETRAEEVIAVGGDGTAHDAALGVIAGGCRAALGIIPAGSGNDFARALGMPKDVRKAVTALTRATVTSIDHGSVRWSGRSGDGESVFVNAIGCGFDAAVAARARTIRHVRGIPRYLLAVLGELTRWESPHVTIESENLTWEGRALLATVGNGISSGGGFLLTPHADLRDGLLDLCVAHHMSVQRILRIIPAVLRARHLGLPEISFAQIRKVKITFGRGVPVHLDGEIATLDATSLCIQVIPKRLKVLTPKPLDEDEKEKVKMY